MSEPDWDLELFKFYTDGLVQWSLLLATSTVGVFAPLTILVNYPSFYFGFVLVIVYTIFTLVSGWCAGRLVGILFMLRTAMPEPMRRRHDALVDIDSLALGPRIWDNDSQRRRQLYQYGLATVIVLLYFLLLGGAISGK